MNGIFLNSRALQRGSVTLMAVVAMAVLGLLGAGVARLSRTETDISANYCDGVAAQQLAEAGVQFALAQLKNDQAYITTGTVSATKNNGTTTGTYTVAVANTGGNQRRITSTGMVGGARRVIVAVVVVNVINPSLPQVGAYAQTLAVTSLSGANTEIHTAGPFPVLADYGGTTHLGNQTHSLPTYNYASFKARALPLPAIVANANNLTSGSGLYYHDGDLTITQNNVNLNGLATGSVVFVNGNITFTNTAGGMNVKDVSFITTLGKNINIQNSANFNRGDLVSGGDIFFNRALVQPGVVIARGTLTMQQIQNINTDAATATQRASNLSNLMLPDTVTEVHLQFSNWNNQ